VTVFHVAAVTSMYGPSDAAQTRINVGGTRTVCEAVEATGAGRLVHVSSTSVFTDPERQRVTHSEWVTMMHVIFFFFFFFFCSDSFFFSWSGIRLFGTDVECSFPAFITPLMIFMPSQSPGSRAGAG
jgi:hypothetical protein